MDSVAACSLKQSFNQTLPPHIIRNLTSFWMKHSSFLHQIQPQTGFLLIRQLTGSWHSPADTGRKLNASKHSVSRWKYKGNQTYHYFGLRRSLSSLKSNLKLASCWENTSLRANTRLEESWEPLITQCWAENAQRKQTYCCFRSKLVFPLWNPIWHWPLV